MKRAIQKNRTRNQRKHSVRANIRAVARVPRFSVYRSNANLYVQIIDDVKGATLASGRTEARPIAKAHALGKLIAEKAIKAGVTTVVFDRGRYAYHGRVKALAEGAREGGLKF